MTQIKTIGISYVHVCSCDVEDSLKFHYDCKRKFSAYFSNKTFYFFK